jgi:diguanylate cyclase (GGDEF)-like protein
MNPAGPAEAAALEAAAHSEAAALEAAAWSLAYRDPSRSGELGRVLAGRGPRWAAAGHLLAAFAEVRAGDESRAARHLGQCRTALAAAPDARIAALADETEVIALRRQGRLDEAGALIERLDARPDPGWRALDRFIALNSRAVHHKLTGRPEQALRLFHDAAEAAQAADDDGARVTALANLGAQHQILFNLDDARSFCEQALEQALEVGAKPVAAAVAANLVVAYHAAGDAARALAMAQWLASGDPCLPADAAERHRLPRALGHLEAGDVAAAQALLDQGAVAAAADGDGVVFWAWLQARCHLLRGEAQAAAALAARVLAQRPHDGAWDQPQSLMGLLRAAAEAAEQLGDPAGALALERRAQCVYEQLVGRSARARWIALQAGQQVARAERERDRALEASRRAEADQRHLAELNAALQAKVAETEALYAKLREQALRDPLTGLYNRRHLFEAGTAMLELARRQGSVLCVVLLDLDHFKLLNDTYGHQAGDAVLQQFAAALTHALRRSDLAFRHGGEEFVALMPDLGADDAQAVLDRLQDGLQADPPPTPGRRRPPRCTFSAGVATFPAHGHTLEHLLSRADKALYRAKHLGRSRVEQAQSTRFGAG